jgi:hypothetical protein
MAYNDEMRLVDHKFSTSSFHNVAQVEISNSAFLQGNM